MSFPLRMFDNYQQYHPALSVCDAALCWIVFLGRVNSGSVFELVVVFDDTCGFT
jgi:hypothetical protein